MPSQFLPADNLILDGEAVVADSRGVPDFGLLHADLAAGRKDRLLYYAFDLLYLDDFDLRRRPQKLVRHVRGTTFYHKGQLPSVPDAVHRLTIEKREGGEGTRLWVDDLAGLLGLVEIGAVELHAWKASVDDIEHPDMLVFDLDPGEGVAWDLVIETALRLRAMLKDEGLEPWPKLTGGKGLHLIAPLHQTIDRDEARAYAKRIAQRLAETTPHRYTIAAAPESRAGQSSSITCVTAGARPRSAPGRRERGRDFRSRPGELAPNRERDPSGRLHDGAASGQRPLRLRAMLWRVRRQLGRCRGYDQRCLGAMQEEEPELNPGAGPVSSRKAP